MSANDADDGDQEYRPDGTVSSKVVRAQIVGLIARHAMTGAPWHEIWARPMKAHGISVQEIESEIKKRIARSLVASTVVPVLRGPSESRLAIAVRSVWLISVIVSVFVPVFIWVVVGVQVVVGLFLLVRSRQNSFKTIHDFKLGILLLVCTVICVGIKLMLK